MTDYTLYELGAHLRAAMAAISEAETSEEIDEACERLDLLGDLESEKAEGYVHVMKNFESIADARREEAKRFYDRMMGRSKAAANKAERLKQRLMDHMKGQGREKIAAGSHEVAIVANGGKQPLEVLVPPEKLPGHLQRVSYAADQDALRELIAKSGGERCEWAALKPRGEHLRVR